MRMNTRAGRGAAPGAAQPHQRRDPAAHELGQRRVRAGRLERRRPLDVDAVDRAALHGRDQPVLVAEVVADRAGVGHARLGQHVAHRRRGAPPLGQQQLGGVEQPLPSCAVGGHAPILR
jgi:hypothetical protein